MTRMKVWMLAALVACAWSGAAARGQNDGSIAAWGRNHFGQCNLPPPNADFIGIAAGASHSLGLKADACYADCDGGGTLDLFDFLCFVNLFNAGDEFADCDGNGAMDLFDFLCFVNQFNAGC